MRPGLRDRRGRRAATTVELALVLNVLLLMLFATIEYGLFEMTRQVVASAAQTGARSAIASTRTASTSQIQAIVASRFVNLPLSNASVTVYLSDSSGNNIGAWTSARFGQTIAVAVTGTYRQVAPVPGLMPSTVTISTTCLLRCEVD